MSYFVGLIKKNKFKINIYIYYKLFINTNFKYAFTYYNINSKFYPNTNIILNL